MTVFLLIELRVLQHGEVSMAATSVLGYML